MTRVHLVRWARAIALVALAALGVTPLPAQDGDPTPREAEAAVLFGHIPASIHDVPEWVLLDLTAEGADLRSVSFRRQPYRLSDGVQMLQTPPGEAEAYVRQVIEHPLAVRTVVVYPDEPTTAGVRAARLLAMADLAALNPGRPLLAIDRVSGPAPFLSGSPLGATPTGTARTVGATPDAARAWELVAVERSTIDAFSALMQLASRPLPPATAGVNRALESTSAIVRSTVEALVAARDPVVGTLLFGQVLVEVERIERDIRRAIAANRVTDADLGTIDDLQDRFASVIGGSDLVRLVFEPEYGPTREALGLLRQIDRFLRTATETSFAAGLANARLLLTEQVPVAAARAHGDGLLRSVEAAAAGSLVFAEVPATGLYELIRASLATSEFNLVIMGGKASGATMATRPATHRAAYSDPSLTADPWWAAVEEIRVRAAGARLDPGTAVVTFQPAGPTSAFVGVALRSAAGEAQSRLLLLRAGNPREIGATVSALLAAGSIDRTEARVLSGWALVAQAAIDL